MRRRKTSKKISDELAALAKRNRGRLTTESVLGWASKNKTSAIWQSLEHDQRKVLVLYYHIQIRKLIACCYIEVEGVDDDWVETREYVSLPRDQVKGEGFRDIRRVLNSKSQCLQLLEAAKDDADQFKAKYEMLHQVKAIVEAIDDFRDK